MKKIISKKNVFSVFYTDSLFNFFPILEHCELLMKVKRVQSKRPSGDVKLRAKR